MSSLHNDGNTLVMNWTRAPNFAAYTASTLQQITQKDVLPLIGSLFTGKTSISQVYNETQLRINRRMKAHIVQISALSLLFHGEQDFIQYPSSVEEWLNQQHIRKDQICVFDSDIYFEQKDFEFKFKTDRTFVVFHRSNFELRCGSFSASSSSSSSNASTTHSFYVFPYPMGEELLSRMTQTTGGDGRDSHNRTDQESWSEIHAQNDFLQKTLANLIQIHKIFTFESLKALIPIAVETSRLAFGNPKTSDDQRQDKQQRRSQKQEKGGEEEEEEEEEEEHEEEDIHPVQHLIAHLHHEVTQAFQNVRIRIPVQLSPKKTFTFTKHTIKERFKWNDKTLHKFILSRSFLFLNSTKVLFHKGFTLEQAKSNPFYEIQMKSRKQIEQSVQESLFEWNLSTKQNMQLKHWGLLMCERLDIETRLSDNFEALLVLTDLLGLYVDCRLGPWFLPLDRDFSEDLFWKSVLTSWRFETKDQAIMRYLFPTISISMFTPSNYQALSPFSSSSSSSSNASATAKSSFLLVPFPTSPSSHSTKGTHIHYLSLMHPTSPFVFFQKEFRTQEASLFCAENSKQNKTKHKSLISQVPTLILLVEKRIIQLLSDSKIHGFKRF